MPDQVVDGEMMATFIGLACWAHGIKLPMTRDGLFNHNMSSSQIINHQIEFLVSIDCLKRWDRASIFYFNNIIFRYHYELRENLGEIKFPYFSYKEIKWVNSKPVRILNKLSSEKGDCLYKVIEISDGSTSWYEHNLLKKKPDGLRWVYNRPFCIIDDS